MTINQEFCNISHISRSLRYDEFTMKLAEGEKFVCRFSKNISGLFQQNLTFLTNKHCLNPILKNSNEKAMISLQNRVFGRRKKLAIYILNTFFFIVFAKFNTWRSQKPLRKEGLDYHLWFQESRLTQVF